MSLNEYKNSIINKIFSGIISNDLESKESFIITETKDFSIIHTAKVASSYIDALFKDDIDTTVVNVEYNRKLNILRTIGSQKIEFKINEKKPIIVLYRNPLFKFCSGILQDFIGNITNRTILLSDYLCSNFDFDSDDTFNHMNTQRMIDKLKEPNKNVIDLFKKFILLSFKYGTLFETHASLHTDSLFTLLNNKVSLTSKDFLIDIDDDNTMLENVLLKLKPDLEKTSKIKLNANKSNTSIDHWILWESLVNDNFEFFQSEWWLDVCQRLNNEYSSYLKLKQKKINLI